MRSEKEREKNPRHRFKQQKCHVPQHKGGLYNRQLSRMSDSTLQKNKKQKKFTDLKSTLHSFKKKM